MQRYFTFSGIAVIGLFLASVLHAQNSTAPSSNMSVVHFGQPAVFNFNALAAYDLAHPQKSRRHMVEQGEEIEKNFKPQDAVITGNPYVYAVPAAKQAVRSISPAPAIVFTGTISNQSLIPPDVNGVAGDNYIFHTNNQEFDLFTKAGVHQSTININTFFSASLGAAGKYYDPHVVYDIQRKRFIVVIDGNISSNNDGGLFIAVSETSDPTGNWYMYSIDGGDNNTADLLDYPLVGYNKNWLVITCNDFIGNTSHTAGFVLNRDDLYNGISVSANTFTDSKLFSLCPAVTEDTTQATEYLVCNSNGNSGGNGYMQIANITGTANAPVYSAGTTVGVNKTWSGRAVGPTQLGNTQTFDPGDTRVSSATYVNGALWFAHTVFEPANTPTYCAVDWWQVNPATPAVKQFGRIADTAATHSYFYPSIAVDQRGDALVGYSRSGPNIYAGAAYSYHDSADAANTMRSGFTYQAGLASYSILDGTRNRWGDYSFTCVDPVNSSFWTLQEFANTPTNTWSTSIANIVTVPCRGKPTAGIISVLKDTICVGRSTVLNLNGYTTLGTGITFKWQIDTGASGTWFNGGGSDSLTAFNTPAITGPTYYRCIARCATSGLYDTSATATIHFNAVTGFATDTFCAEGIHSISAKGIGGINWYPNSYATIPVATGNTFLANIVSDTTLYVSAGAIKSYASGAVSDSIGKGSYVGAYSIGLTFTALADFTLDSFYVYPSDTGVVTINLIDANTGSTITSVSNHISTFTINKKTVLHLGLPVSGGNTYNITPAGSTLQSLYRNTTGGAYPYTIANLVSILHTTTSSTTNYMYFYNWHVSTGCATERVAVPVHLIQIPMKAALTNDSICKGDMDTLTIHSSHNLTYTWQPGGVTDSVLIVSPTTTTVYTVTGTDTKGCTGTVQLEVALKASSICNAGINTPAYNPSLNVYPNPVTGQLNIVFANYPNKTYTVSIINVLGQNMTVVNHTVSSTRETMPIDVSSFANGIYYLRITDGTHQWVVPVEKQ